MSRYTGSTFKKSRRYGFSILENGKEFSKGKKRQYAPGQHGQRRVKLSDYGLHLYEKQKVKYMYGLSEKQFKNTFIKSSKQKGIVGTNFLQMLETRIDNVVYRMGFAKTRRQARQLINHGHFLLNGNKVSTPSIQVKTNDLITLKEKSQKNTQILSSIEEANIASWISFDQKKMEGKLEKIPERKDLNTEINEALIVEYYNK